jgi:nicotinate-nucleotide--dimethylbenzimidazole phosphoribosyltransferase
VSRWGVVTSPRAVEGGSGEAGRLEPALQRLAAWQGAWPPHRPVSVPVVVEAGGTLDDGRDDADALVDAGADLLLVTTGAGEELAVEALVVVAALLDLEPVRAVGTAPGTDWVGRTIAVRDGLRVGRPHRGAPADLLEALGATAVTRAAGVLAQAASRRTPALLDGSMAVAAAALSAARLAPGAQSWWLAGVGPPVPAAAEAHRELQLEPLLDLGLAGAAGGSIALSVLEQACDLVAPA